MCSEHLLAPGRSHRLRSEQEGQVANETQRHVGRAEEAGGMQERQLDLEFTSKAEPEGSEQPGCGVRRREMRQSPGFWPEQLEGK